MHCLCRLQSLAIYSGNIGRHCSQLFDDCIVLHSVDVQRDLLHWVVVGWMLLPAWGLADTARRTPAPSVARVYLGAAVASVAGAALAVVGLAAPASLPAAGWVVLAGIAVTGVGQTASIVAAARQS